MKMRAWPGVACALLQLRLPLARRRRARLDLQLELLLFRLPLCTSIATLRVPQQPHLLAIAPPQDGARERRQQKTSLDTVTGTTAAQESVAHPT
jgi:hypothetical protein